MDHATLQVAYSADGPRSTGTAAHCVNREDLFTPKKIILLLAKTGMKVWRPEIREKKEAKVGLVDHRMVIKEEEEEMAMEEEMKVENGTKAIGKEDGKVLKRIAAHGQVVAGTRRVEDGKEEEKDGQNVVAFVNLELQAEEKAMAAPKVTMTVLVPPWTSLL